jgi:hypothetical protein
MILINSRAVSSIINEKKISSVILSDGIRCERINSTKSTLNSIDNYYRKLESL